MAGRRREPEAAQAVRLRKAATRYTAAERRADDERAQLRIVVREVHAGGASVRAIAALVNLSVGRVHELIAGKRSAPDHAPR